MNVVSKVPLESSREHENQPLGPATLCSCMRLLSSNLRPTLGSCRKPKKRAPHKRSPLVCLLILGQCQMVLLSVIGSGRVSGCAREESCDLLVNPHPV